MINAGFNPLAGFNSRTLGRVRLYLLAELSDHQRFNSRTLGRVRLRFNTRLISKKLFQFTHPGKGATPASSISSIFWFVFQFTHPGKGATQQKEYFNNPLSVSIHAPWEGCDLARVATTVDDDVSIHAPWEGCDDSHAETP